MNRFPSALLAGLIVTSFCVPGGFAQQDALAIQDISLESLLNVRVSTASKYEQTAREAPAAVTVITAEDIERYGYESLGDVLASVRGFYTSYDRNYAYLGTRGFGRPTDDNNRILVLINGLSTNDGIRRPLRAARRVRARAAGPRAGRTQRGLQSRNRFLSPSGEIIIQAMRRGVGESESRRKNPRLPDSPAPRLIKSPALRFTLFDSYFPGMT